VTPIYQSVYWSHGGSEEKPHPQIIIPPSVMAASLFPPELPPWDGAPPWDETPLRLMKIPPVPANPPAPLEVLLPSLSASRPVACKVLPPQATRAVMARRCDSRLIASMLLRSPHLLMTNLARLSSVLPFSGLGAANSAHQFYADASAATRSVCNSFMGSTVSGTTSGSVSVDPRFHRR